MNNMSRQEYKNLQLIISKLQRRKLWYEMYKDSKYEKIDYKNIDLESKYKAFSNKEADNV